MPDITGSTDTRYTLDELSQIRVACPACVSLATYVTPPYGGRHWGPGGAQFKCVARGSCGLTFKVTWSELRKLMTRRRKAKRLPAWQRQ